MKEFAYRIIVGFVKKWKFNIIFASKLVNGFLLIYKFINIKIEDRIMTIMVENKQIKEIKKTYNLFYIKGNSFFYKGFLRRRVLFIGIIWVEKVF